MQTSWITPIVSSVALPVHAMTSRCALALAADADTVPIPAAVTVDVFYSLVILETGCIGVSRSETVRVGQPLSTEFRLSAPSSSVTIRGATGVAGIAQNSGFGAIILPDLSTSVSVTVIDQLGASWTATTILSRTATTLTHATITFTRSWLG